MNTLSIVSQIEDTYQKCAETLSVSLENVKLDGKQKICINNKSSVVEHAEALYTAESCLFDMRKMVKDEVKRLQVHKRKLEIRSKILWANTEEKMKSSLMLWCDEIQLVLDGSRSDVAELFLEVSVHEYLMQKKSKDVTAVKLFCKFTVEGLTFTLKALEETNDKNQSKHVKATLNPFVPDFETNFANALNSGMSFKNFVKSIGCDGCKFLKV